MKKLIIMTLLLSLVSTVLAADSTPSALELFNREVASKAAKLKQLVDIKLKDKAYIGKVKTKSPSSITLATENGPKIVNINQDTEFDSNFKGKKYSQKLIIEEDYLAALGDIDETDVQTARKIVLLPQPKTDKTYLWGQVVAASDKLITIKDRDHKSIAISLPNQSRVKISDHVILTGILGKNDIFEAEFVYVIPQSGILRPKKIATPSATPKPVSH